MKPPSGFFIIVPPIILLWLVIPSTLGTFISSPTVVPAYGLPTNGNTDVSMDQSPEHAMKDMPQLEKRTVPPSNFFNMKDTNGTSSILQQQQQQQQHPTKYAVPDDDTIRSTGAKLLPQNNTTPPTTTTTDSSSPMFSFSRNGWGNRPNGIDILIATFFLVAAIWLFIAIVYSIMILLILRMQARGDLDVYDEGFGQIYCCNGRIRLALGCLLRRYAIQLEYEDQRRAAGTSERRRVRIMTRGERRAAMEALLLSKQVPIDPMVRVASSSSSSSLPSTGLTTPNEQGCGGSVNGDGPVCSICLGEYGR